MTQGSIWRQLAGFSLPMAIGLLFQQLYNTVDTIVVGQFVSTQALAAVGSTSSIINMLVCARLRHVAGAQWGNKKYMNMKHLEAICDDASLAG